MRDGRKLATRKFFLRASQEKKGLDAKYMDEREGEGTQ